ncbi:MAG: transporter substrate-binding domain-containing protein [Firmicutes bacterium]|nr:transporter substrate-binding domain-containing protein [Bacillota bacterium]
MKRIFTLLFTIIIITSSFAGLSCEKAEALTTNIKVGYCAYFSPFQFVDSNEEPDGFNVDILNLIASRTDLVLEYIPFGTTNEAMEKLEKGEIDMVLGVIEDNIFDYNVLLTDPLSTTNICMVASNNAAEKYHSTNILRGSIIVEFDFIRRSSLTKMGKTIISAGNQERSIEMLLDGRAELLAGIKEGILWNLEEAGRTDEFEIINNYIDSADIVIAVREGDRQLCNNVNETLSSLRTSSVYDDLYNKWFSFATVDYRQLFRIAMAVIIGVLIAVAVYMLISFRKRAAQAEAESRLRYSIIESSPAAMVLIDQKNSIEYMNRKAMNMAGIREYSIGDELTGMKIFSEIIEKNGGNIFENDWETKAGTIDYYKKRGRTGKEKYRYNIQKMTPFGNQTGALLTVENITSEEREREAAFEKEKNETLNNLIAGIAHEIKNPLTAINASAAMMEKKGHNEKFRQAFTEHIPQEIDRITRLIDNLLDYARPGVSKIEEVSLPEVIRSVYELSKVTAKKTQIILNIEEEAGITVRGDKDKLKQTLLNLMINSIEATKNMAARDNKIHNITIDCYTENDSAVIRITDDGIGMTEQELERCTTPFWTTKKAGTGIGLALAKQYIEEAGGRMTIDSAKNQFTCVEIQLPVSGGEEGN